ncbi:twitching motility protein PilT [Salinirubellus salinus]|uniref:Twitching motility protein PilT n=1 Tax=Salinirubellus salinus TaxID=1364945 RepID=A0A9E7UCX5_9EURY|nr:twitching motility protein PilT [Salinirubellus salinus]UWM56747.1 twitching motility protein PilT [Salinirubellus salinus]
MNVVLDTNALMMPVELDVRLFDELDRILPPGYELFVPEAVLDELAKLSSGAGTEATAASVGADLAERATPVEHDAPYADDAVLEVARELEATVVTNDRPLRDRLFEAGVPVIGLRGHNKLERNEP